MAVDFSKYASLSVDTIERPSAPPTGHYTATFQAWKFAERFYEGKGGPATPVVELTFKITGAEDDASEADPSGAEKAVNKLMTKDYQLNEEGGQFAIRRFVEETCGIDGKGLNLSDALDAAKSSDVRLFNQQKAGKEEGQFFTNVTKIFPA